MLQMSLNHNSIEEIFKIDEINLNHSKLCQFLEFSRVLVFKFILFKFLLNKLH